MYLCHSQNAAVLTLDACSRGMTRSDLRWLTSSLYSHNKSVPHELADLNIAWLPIRTYRTLMNCPHWTNVCTGHYRESIYSGLVIYKLRKYEFLACQ